MCGTDASGGDDVSVAAREVQHLLADAGEVVTHNTHLGTQSIVVTRNKSSCDEYIYISVSSLSYASVINT